MISPDEIAADRAVIDAATGGDWQVLVGASWAGEVVVATSDGHPIAVVSTAPADPGAIADATAIAAARTGWPRALDALEVMADAVLDEMTRAEKAEAAIARLAEDAATFERMFREALDGKREAEAAVARVRALTEDEWGPLSDDVERCALCRRKWSKHGDDDADHPAVSSALVAYVIDLRDALDGGDDDD